MSWTLGVANGDLDIDIYGRFVRVSGRDKCSQDLSEMLLSYYEEDRDYGSSLHPGVVPNIAGRAFIAAELHAVVSRLQHLQQESDNSDEYEALDSITSMIVNTVSGDPTSYTYKLVVETETGESASTTSVVKYRQMQFGHLAAT